MPSWESWANTRQEESAQVRGELLRAGTGGGGVGGWLQSEPREVLGLALWWGWGTKSWECLLMQGRGTANMQPGSQHRAWHGVCQERWWFSAGSVHKHLPGPQSLGCEV